MDSGCWWWRAGWIVGDDESAAGFNKPAVSLRPGVILTLEGFYYDALAFVICAYYCFFN